MFRAAAWQTFVDWERVKCALGSVSASSILRPDGEVVGAGSGMQQSSVSMPFPS
jgi:hypothetical protein